MLLRTISIFPVHHFQYQLLAISGRSGIYLPMISLVAFFLLVFIPQRWLTTESSISRCVLNVYLDIVCTSPIWAHCREVRRFFIKSLFYLFQLKFNILYTEEWKIGFEEINFASAPCYYGISYRGSKTFTSHALIFI